MVFEPTGRQRSCVLAGVLKTSQIGVDFNAASNGKQRSMKTASAWRGQAHRTDWLLFLINSGCPKLQHPSLRSDFWVLELFANNRPWFLQPASSSRAYGRLSLCAGMAGTSAPRARGPGSRSSEEGGLVILPRGGGRADRRRGPERAGDAERTSNRHRCRRGLQRASPSLWLPRACP